jgi:hypothetical protein
MKQCQEKNERKIVRGTKRQQPQNIGGRENALSFFYSDFDSEKQSFLDKHKEFMKFMEQMNRAPEIPFGLLEDQKSPVAHLETHVEPQEHFWRPQHFVHPQHFGRPEMPQEAPSQRYIPPWARGFSKNIKTKQMPRVPKFLHSIEPKQRSRPIPIHIMARLMIDKDRPIGIPKESATHLFEQMEDAELMEDTAGPMEATAPMEDAELMEALADIEV